ncbi:hypothetical protein PIB30_012359 [Stylosanthes scabra]|uniref:Uncharacterized protein n=1 Tax=Stylosanthes scabra TaxID=79078 RepID=A0ABU6Z6H0_9FABA|nr:hypothetical protein [Stylosanthes scabra]
MKALFAAYSNFKGYPWLRIHENDGTLLFRVNTEPNESSPLQAWVVGMSPINESPNKQAGRRTCKTLRRSSQTGGEIVPPLILAMHARPGRDSQAGSGQAPLLAGGPGRLLGLLKESAQRRWLSVKACP